MADFDLGTLASAFIPAAIGGILGGGRGAAIGAASGIDRSYQQADEFQRYQERQQRLDRVDQREQQRIALEERRTVAQEQRDQMLNKEAEAQIAAHAQTKVKNQFEIDRLQRDEEYRKKKLETATDPKEREFLERGDWKGYDKYTAETQARAGMGSMLKKFGHTIDPETLKNTPMPVLEHLFNKVIDRRYEKGSFHYAIDNKGNLHTFRDGAEIGKPQPGFGTNQAKNDAIEGVRKEWQSFHKEGTDDDFADFISSPRGDLAVRRRTGEITPEEYQKELGTIRRQEDKDESAALKDVRQEWEKTFKLTSPSDEKFKAYLRSSAGRDKLQSAREKVKSQREGGTGPTTETKPAAAAKKSGERPSLDDIFGK